MLLQQSLPLSAKQSGNLKLYSLARYFKDENVAIEKEQHTNIGQEYGGEAHGNHNHLFASGQLRILKRKIQQETANEGEQKADELNETHTQDSIVVVQTTPAHVIGHRELP